MNIKEQLTNALKKYVVGGEITSTDSEYVSGREFSAYDLNAIRLAYRGNYAVYSIISKCADIAADTITYLGYRNSNEEWDLKSPYLKALLKPNSTQTMREFAKAYAVNRLLYGEAFIYAVKKVGLSAGQIAQMNVAPSNLVEINNGREWTWLGTEDVYTIGNINYPAEEFIHVKNYNVDESYRGLPPLIPAAMLAEKIKRGVLLENRNFDKGNVDILLQTKSNSEGMYMRLSDSQVSEAETDINSKRGKKVKISRTAFDKIDLGKTPLDLGVLQSTDAAVKALMFVFNLPYSTFSGDGTFNNTAEGFKALYTQVGIPIATEFLEAYARHIDLKDGEFDIRIDDIPHLRPSMTEKLTALTAAHASTNELREAAGLPKLDVEPSEMMDKPIFPLAVSFGTETTDLEI